MAEKKAERKEGVCKEKIQDSFPKPHNNKHRLCRLINKKKKTIRFEELNLSWWSVDDEFRI